MTVKTCSSVPGPPQQEPDPAPYDTLLAVYTGSSLNSLTEVASNDNASCGSELTFLAHAGTAYSLAVAFNSSTSHRRASIGFAGKPWNDDFADATAVGADLPASFWSDTAQATKEPAEPDHAGDPGGRSVWYRVTPDADGPMTVDFCTGFPSLVAVYRGADIAHLTEAASASTSGCGFDSYLTFRAAAGTTYYVAMDGKAGASGWLDARFQAGEPPVPTIDEPAEGSLVADGTPSLSGAGSTAPGDERAVSVNVAAGPFPFGSTLRNFTVPVGTGGHWSVAVAPALPGGLYSAVAWQKDSTGRSWPSNVRTFRVPTVGPTTGAGPAAGSLVPDAFATADPLVTVGGAVVTATPTRFNVRVRNGNPFPVTCALAAATARPVVAARSRARKLKLGSARFRLPAHGARTVGVRLSAKGRRLLARRRRLRVRVTLVVRDPRGASRRAAKTITLKAVRRPKRTRR
jgi:hypothetical protein